MGRMGWTVGLTNICFDCKNACGKCPWSAFDPKTGTVAFKPVPGWTAEEVEQIPNYRYKYSSTTYHITACPLFERDEPRKASNAELTPEEEKAWIEAMRREYGVWADG